MIDKIIHYVWVGKKPLGKLESRCISSWKDNLPEYDVKLWNEANSPMESNFVKEMYSRGKWAFVSDYIRFWVLYNHGGIYLDTDMEVLKSLDDLLDDEVFFARTSSDGYISCGIIGAEKGNMYVGKILEYYNSITDFDNVETSPEIVTKVLGGEDITVHEANLFYPCNAGEKCDSDKLNNAYTNHHWSESWVRYRMLRKFLRKIGVLALLKKINESLRN